MSFAPGLTAHQGGSHERVGGYGLVRVGRDSMVLTRISADKALPFDVNRVQAQPDTKKKQ